MSSNNPKANGESEAHSRLTFGGEERIKDSRLYISRHTSSGIADRNTHAVAVIFSRKSELTSVRHRINSIKDHVYQHLAQFRFVSHDFGFRTNLQVEAYLNIPRFGSVLPARTSDFTDIEQNLVDGYWLKIMIPTLPCKILDAFDSLRTVFCRFNDDV